MKHITHDCDTINISKPYTEAMSHHKIIPAVFLVILKNDQVLLLRRKNTGHGDGKLSLIAGHIDPGETPTEAACREAYEEVDILIQTQNLHHVFTLYRLQDGEERVDFFFQLKVWDGKIILKEPDKSCEVFFCDIKKLPDDVLPYVAYVLERLDTSLQFAELRE